MAYNLLKTWMIPLWSKGKSISVGKTLRCCAGAVLTHKRDLLGPSLVKFYMQKMDISSTAGEGQCQEDPAVSLFREYLRIKTVHPDPDYGTRFNVLWIFLKYLHKTGFRIFFNNHVGIRLFDSYHLLVSMCQHQIFMVWWISTFDNTTKDQSNIATLYMISLLF